MRYDVQWEVKVSAEHWRDLTQLTATSISQGGMFVQSEQHAEVGSPIQIVLDLPDGSSLQLDGTVVRVVAPDNPNGYAPGLGIRFLGESAGDLHLLEAMVSSLGAAEPAPRLVSRRFARRSLQKRSRSK